MTTRLSTSDYMRAVARALDMPETGINQLSITADFGGPIIVRIVYVCEGTPELLDVLPPPESLKAEAE